MRLALLLLLPTLEQGDVFRAGEGGHHSYRIPTIATAADGSLVVFAEARKENRGDPGLGDLDLVFKRSPDRGKTWSAVRVLDGPGDKWAASKPTPVLDRTNKRPAHDFDHWARRLLFWYIYS